MVAMVARTTERCKNLFGKGLGGNAMMRRRGPAMAIDRVGDAHGINSGTLGLRNTSSGIAFANANGSAARADSGSSFSQSL